MWHRQKSHFEMLRGNVWSDVRSEVILSAAVMSPVSAGTLLSVVPVCGHVAVTSEA